MKTNYHKLLVIKPYVIAIGLFIVLTSTIRSAVSQTCNIGSAPDPDFSGNNMGQAIDGGWHKWKLTGGGFFEFGGLYVFDKWVDLGLGGDLSFDYIAREGSVAGHVTIQNINTSGYGILSVGTHSVNVSCEERTVMTYPIQYESTTGYRDV